MGKKIETTEQTERHADQGYRKFWSTMKELPWKQRFRHFFDYYGKYTLIAILLIFMFTDILVTSLTPKPELVLSGTAINVSVSVEMEKKLTDEAFTAMGGTDPEKQTTDLVPNAVSATDLMTSALQAKLLAGDYHYVLVDEEGLGMILSMQALPSMELVLPKEKLEPWKDRFKNIETDGKTVPIALDITGTVLASGCTYEGEHLYLGFSVNQNTMAAVEPFFDYLIAQGLLQEQ